MNDYLNIKDITILKPLRSIGLFLSKVVKYITKEFSIIHYNLFYRLRNNSGEKVYVIASYGGSGSKMLMRYLSQYGNTMHPHARRPPKFISKMKIDRKTGSKVHFSKLLNDKLHPDNCIVIYIFKDPVKALISRYSWKHCYQIGGDYKNLPISIDDYANNQIDLFKYEEHFDNWTKAKKEDRDYNIMLIKYDYLWDNLDEILQYCNVPLTEKNKFPKRRETKRNIKPETNEKLCRMYRNLYLKIEDHPSIKII